MAARFREAARNGSFPFFRSKSTSFHSDHTSAIVQPGVRHPRGPTQSSRPRPRAERRRAGRSRWATPSRPPTTLVAPPPAAPPHPPPPRPTAPIPSNRPTRRPPPRGRSSKTRAPRARGRARAQLALRAQWPVRPSARAATAAAHGASLHRAPPRARASARPAAHLSLLQGTRRSSNQSSARPAPSTPTRSLARAGARASPARARGAARARRWRQSAAFSRAPFPGPPLPAKRARQLALCSLSSPQRRCTMAAAHRTPARGMVACGWRARVASRPGRSPRPPSPRSRRRGQVAACRVCALSLIHI